MGDVSGLMPFKHAGITKGQILPWPVYDQFGQQLYEAGILIEDQKFFEQLMENGYCDANSLWDSIPSKFLTPEQQTPVAQPSAPASKSTVSEVNKEAIIELDSVRWNVGEILYLQVHDQTAARYTVKLIGFVKNKSVFVTAPVVDGKAALIREGQTFIIRAFPGKKAYAFTASALKYVYSPYPYLHLSYPRQVRSTTIRQGSRAVVKIIAAVTIGNPEQTGAATIGDISMGGASGLIKKPLGEKGDTGIIKFKVNAAGNDEFLTLKIILRSVAPTENGLEFRHGFEFVDVPTQSRLILSAFVHQTLAEMN
ncbi:flagellar brake protein [Undibacterium sp. SXout7W]|uniref:flagellar brake protein n=1 Tax=Undibacterium sp. SXout7W TaxID=3413049 RepID=UPI003BF2F64F